MRKIYLTAITLLLTVISSFGQGILPGQLGGTRNSGLISTSPVIINEYVNGSPYVNEKYLPAAISASEDDVFYVRYNALRDQFEVKGEFGKAYYLNRYRRDLVIEILPLAKSYKVFGFLDEDKNENFGYFVFLTNQNAKHVLFKKEKISFISERIGVTSYDTGRPARYKRWNDKFFIKLDGEKLLTELPKNKKGLAKLFPGKEAQILSYMKENKLRMGKEEHLKQVINYINLL